MSDDHDTRAAELWPKLQTCLYPVEDLAGALRSEAMWALGRAADRLPPAHEDAESIVDLTCEDVGHDEIRDGIAGFLQRRDAAANAAGYARGVEDAEREADGVFSDGKIEALEARGLTNPALQTMVLLVSGSKIETAESIAKRIRALKAVPRVEERWGVWCVEDRAWCMTGTREAVEADLPRWASGRAADIDPRHFNYEIRQVSRG